MKTNEEMVQDVLSECGAESARWLREQGWKGGGAGYNIGGLPGDQEHAETKLGRKLTHYETLMLEASIRTNLDAE